MLAFPADADAPKVQIVPPKGDPYELPSKLQGIPRNMVLYQYEVCPYCCKVKATLDYYKLPYRVVEVNPLTKGELSWTDCRKVPVLRTDDEVLVESSFIVSRLAAEAEASKAPCTVEPSLPKSETKSKSWFGGGSTSPTPTPTAASKSSSHVAHGTPEEIQWRRWVDDKFVKLLTANIYRNFDESVKSFSYITDQSNWGWGTRTLAKWSGAILMWRIGAGMPKKYGIEGDLRQAMYAACNDFVDALGGRKFMGGSAPNLADLSMFGVLRAVETTPAVQDALTHSKIGPWFQAMAAAVGPSSRVSDS